MVVEKMVLRRALTLCCLAAAQRVVCAPRRSVAPGAAALQPAHAQPRPQTVEGRWDAAPDLEGRLLHLSGFSETRPLVNQLALQMGCNMSVEKGDWCQRSWQWSHNLNTSFLATCREALPVESTRCANGATLSYKWKSFFTPDAPLVRQLREQGHGDAIAIFSVGPHQFATQPGHTIGRYYEVADDFTFPQSWMDDWVASAVQFFTWLGTARRAGACVLWKTNNIGTRLPGRVHHPSAQGGSADYLNQLAVALARMHGVPVIDMAPTTLRLTRHDLQRRSPCIYQLSDGHPKPYSERLGQCTGMGNTDVQHGLDAAELVKVVLAGVREHCANASIEL